MKETRNFKLPVIGRVQHGEQIFNDNGKKQVKEYGYFIAKTKQDNMKHYIEKFDKIIRGKQSIDIQFLDDNPLSVRNERNNQGGRACYCMENETIGRQKVKNLWQPIECTTSCQYLNKDPNGKKACNRIAWLKFLIPEISTDRLWLMRITSQEAIDNLRGYLAIQKLQGNSLRGIYTIFLYQAEQVDGNGKIHNNYLVDIIAKDSNIQNTTPQVNQNVDTEKIEKTQKTNTEMKEETEAKISTDSNNKTTSKKTKKSDTKKSADEDNLKKAENKEEKSISENNATANLQSNEIAGDYALISTSEEILKTAQGEKKYVVGQFCDMEDKIHNIYIKPEFAEELTQCDLGTMVNLMVQEKANKKFAIELKYLTKCIKKQVA